MTEAEWVDCWEPLDLLTAVGDQGSRDRLQRYIALCLRAAGADQAAEFVERSFAGEVSEEEVENYRRRMSGQANRTSGGGYSMGRKPGHISPATQRARVAYAALLPGVMIAARAVTRASQHLLRREQCELLRCLFPNPSRPVAFAPAWRSETVVALASGIYAERAFDRLPILADALEEAGCDHADVLAHCRGPGPHARGGWVVDGVLGKS